MMCKVNSAASVKEKTPHEDGDDLAMQVLISCIIAAYGSMQCA